MLSIFVCKTCSVLNYSPTKLTTSPAATVDYFQWTCEEQTCW